MMKDYFWVELRHIPVEVQATFIHDLAQQYAIVDFIDPLPSYVAKRDDYVMLALDLPKDQPFSMDDIIPFKMGGKIHQIHTAHKFRPWCFKCRAYGHLCTDSACPVHTSNTRPASHPASGQLQEGRGEQGRGSKPQGDWTPRGEAAGTRPAPRPAGAAPPHEPKQPAQQLSSSQEQPETPCKKQKQLVKGPAPRDYLPKKDWLHIPEKVGGGKKWQILKRKEPEQASSAAPQNSNAEGARSDTDKGAETANADLLESAFGVEPMEVEVVPGAPPFPPEIEMKEATEVENHSASGGGGTTAEPAANNQTDKLKELAEWLMGNLQIKYQGKDDDFWDDTYKALIAMMENSESLQSAVHNGLPKGVTWPETCQKVLTIVLIRFQPDGSDRISEKKTDPPPQKKEATKRDQPDGSDRISEKKTNPPPQKKEATKRDQGLETGEEVGKEKEEKGNEKGKQDMELPAGEKAGSPEEEITKNPAENPAENPTENLGGQAAKGGTKEEREQGGKEEVGEEEEKGEGGQEGGQGSEGSEGTDKVKGLCLALAAWGTEKAGLREAAKKQKDTVPPMPPESDLTSKRQKIRHILDKGRTATAP
ncbi:hypothetical protein CBR_g19898 [Chara braunii]|uniref:Uncharacterized protein n=1 Tax=Chara braunii TaxID=69332 RepID=A0A388KYX7_CHABU|nr:hypothetical protein CBR_g19898 [Chara braunii]|eukprot:GBG75264.1 hypothetical protein CBR_g19898 [Chara braunii]